MSHHLQIDILGVPNTGAKSRVETQIKLCIQLMTGNDKKVTDWSHIRIGENMLARSRLRKNQQKSLDGSVATMVSDESSILQLEAKVVCASNTDHPIRMCVGCVRREVSLKLLLLLSFLIIFVYRKKEQKEQKMVNKRMNLFLQIKN